MKQFLLGLITASVLVVAVAFSRQAADPKADLPPNLQILSEARNPWTNLRMNSDPLEFQFAVVSDRTGGHREKIFSKAVEQLNLLQPEFVLSVGDLIEGYSTDREKIAKEWKEFQNFTSRLQMPFFYVVGNHDIANVSQEKIWEEKFGRRYYHFVYKNVLFLQLCSEDPPGSTNITPDQVAYIKKALEENKNVHWTIVSLHKPIWNSDVEKNGWGDVEKLLAGRNYTVFAGHVHRYQKFVRQGMNYYQLATTGGGSKLRGVNYGEFDHLVWITMKKSGPILANIMLDGIYPEDLQVPQTVEPVIPFDRKPTHPVRGFVYFDGAPPAGATVAFHQKATTMGKDSYRVIADGLIEGDGSFTLSSNGPFDGAPVGEYFITVVYDGRYPFNGKKIKNDDIPSKFTKPDTSDLKATVKSGPNEFTVDMRK
ncbi:MAG: metallophosphoesterase [Planctomycetes bacterium]|nr:metallophosphoesterase [Planctomycetota bacterium]